VNIRNSSDQAPQFGAEPTYFCAPWYLKNPHLQAILSSSRIRKHYLTLQHPTLEQNAEQLILDCGNGVRLSAELNRATTSSNAQSLIILLHGWEGSSRSNYILSAAAQFLAAGHDVCRLNLRDHGNSHHLNRGLFNSSLVEEVAGAIKTLQLTYEYSKTGLMGFSLGGNFALRVGLLPQSLAKPLDAILAICPVLDPAETMKVLESGPFWYEQYFVKKWKRSLFKKLEYFPDYDYAKALTPMSRLKEMNEFFIPRYTQYQTVEDYFQSYTITGHKLAFTLSKTSIIATQDDPVIPPADLSKIARPAHLSVSLQAHGSHCAFIRGIKKPSWADTYAQAFFEDCFRQS